MSSPAAPALSDLLDRVLDKGVVINAQLVITLGGVPLVGVNLWAAVGGMETLLQYGLMDGWDQELRQEQAPLLTPAPDGPGLPEPGGRGCGARAEETIPHPPFTQDYPGLG